MGDHICENKIAQKMTLKYIESVFRFGYNKIYKAYGLAEVIFFSLASLMSVCGHQRLT